MPALLVALLLAGLEPVPAATPEPASAAAANPDGKRGFVERRLALMGTRLHLEVEACDRAAALAAAEAAVRALEQTERRLSTWREDSELARLNRAPAGERVPLSPELAAELAAARRCWEETEGAFDPGVGALVEAWGLRYGGREPNAEERYRARASGGMGALVLAGDGTATRRDSALRLEEGGFGKGAGLDAALVALANAPEVERARLDLGGQVAVLGVGPWTVAVADPRDRARAVAELVVAGGSVATSGNAERGFEAGGVRYGHLLDPRRGEPAPDFGSVTVWASEALRADCLATGFFVLGPEAALAWAAGRTDAQVLVLETTPGGLRGRASAGLRGRLRSLAPDVTIEFSQESAPRIGAHREPGAVGSSPPGH